MPSTPFATFRLSTPPAPGAIAVIDLFGDVDRLCRALEIKLVEVGKFQLRDLAGIDEGLVVRWSERHAQFMPHAGPYVVQELIKRLITVGAVEERELDPCSAYPEATDIYEACMLDALAQAQSPAAIPMLLEQPERWRCHDGAPFMTPVDVERQLNRLLNPATVVAVGRPNVGKSTLINALARSAVSIVADEPGTTRDHVGVSLELPSPFGGVVIRWIDAPGFRSESETDDPIELTAMTLARSVVASADLIVHCGDAAHGFVDLGLAGVLPSQPVIRVGMRIDEVPVPDCDVSTAAKSDLGVRELADVVRRAIVSDVALWWPGPWYFHPWLPGPAPLDG